MKKSSIIQHGWNWMEEPKRLGKFALIRPCVFTSIMMKSPLVQRVQFFCICWLHDSMSSSSSTFLSTLFTFFLSFFFSRHELCHTITPAQINYWLAMSSAYYHHFWDTFRFKWERAKQKLRLLLFSSAIILYGFTDFPPSQFAEGRAHDTHATRERIFAVKKETEN